MKKFFVSAVAVLLLSGCAATQPVPVAQNLPTAPALEPNLETPAPPQVVWSVVFVDKQGMELGGGPDYLPPSFAEQKLVKTYKGKTEIIIPNLLEQARGQQKVADPVTAQTFFEVGPVTRDGLTLLQYPAPTNCNRPGACQPAVWYASADNKKIKPLLKVTELFRQSGPPIYPQDVDATWGIAVPGPANKDCQATDRVMNIFNLETDEVIKRIILALGQSFSPRTCAPPTIVWETPASISYKIYDSTAANPPGEQSKPVLGNYTIDAF